ncbi:hypothetical protein [Psychroflexus aestuariivivens]|uniref:hypothetical protein n=1 Tax=Psychroflexus aestuariivivens TaxID=1795040 RepID=UPI000FD875B4|nr:hypothetical protein [Psychroflexus aestuariivivens]
MSKLYLKFDQSRYDNQIKMISNIAKIYTDAANELLKLDVKGYKAENLINGDFITLFDEYHKSEHSKIKDPVFKKLSYEKYLDLRELDTTKLEELQSEHEKRKNFCFELYEVNDLFFTKAETNQTRNISFAKAMNSAPVKRRYTIDKVLSFKGNKAIINIPKKPFEVHALNRNQIDLMQDVSDFINTSRKLGLTYEKVKPHIAVYLSDLSIDLKTFSFDFNEILKSRL